MKSLQILLASFFILFYFNSWTQNRIDSVVYSLADTVTANRLLKESIELNSKKDFNKAFAKADSAQFIFEKVFGKNCKLDVQVFTDFLI